MAQIEFTTREKKLILILRKVREDWSYSDIARTLNDILPEDKLIITRLIYNCRCLLMLLRSGMQ